MIKTIKVALHDNNRYHAAMFLMSFLWANNALRRKDGLESFLTSSPSRPLSGGRVYFILATLLNTIGPTTLLLLTSLMLPPCTYIKRLLQLGWFPTLKKDPIYKWEIPYSPEPAYLYEVPVNVTELPDNIEYYIRILIESPPQGLVVEEIEPVTLGWLGSIGKS